MSEKSLSVSKMLANDDSDNVKLKVRRDLSEEKARRFREVIMQASYQLETIVDPRKFTDRGMNGLTFVSRFTDALLAYKKFGYPLATLPPGFRLEDLSAKERNDGKVVIKNKHMEHLVRVQGNELPSVRNLAHCALLIEQIKNGSIMSQEFRCESEADAKTLKAMCFSTLGEDGEFSESLGAQGRFVKISKVVRESEEDEVIDPSQPFTLG